MQRFFKKYFLVVALFVFALFHLVLTENTFMSPWKGGGYGMYSEYHPRNYDIWIETDSERLSLAKAKIDDYKRLERLTKAGQTFPNAHNLSKLKRLLDEQGYNVKAIEIWRPDFNVETQQYSRTLITRYEGQ